MKNSISMNWDNMVAAGNHKKGKKGGPFISRMTGRTAEGARHSTAGKVRGLAFHEKIKLEKGPEIPVNRGADGSFYYQARIGGRFGKRMEISPSLAAKLQG